MILDLFAGPGGWDEGLRQLDPTLHARTVGVELELQTCWTRRDAGHKTIRGDLSTFIFDLPALRPRIDGLIASPPCQPFSRAASSKSVRGFDDPKGLLTLIPGEYIIACEPDWIAFEQVMQVLPVWEELAYNLLPRLGYSTWAGILDAQHYGVPQMRKRAILLASRTRLVRPPVPTTPTPISIASALNLDTSLTHVQTRGNKQEGGNYFPTSSPSWTLTGKTRSWYLVPGNPTGFAADRRHSLDRPAPTLHFGHSGGHWRWKNEDPDVPARQVTLSEALILQGFPPDYPLRGSRTSKYLQLGQAVPPPLARACLAQVLPRATVDPCTASLLPGSPASLVG